MEKNIERITIYHTNAVKPNSEFSHTDVFEEIESFQLMYTYMSSDPTGITFIYAGKSTGKRSRATFNLENIAGYSLTYKDKEEL